jgi:peroxiredoxin Q/BCP
MLIINNLKSQDSLKEGDFAPDFTLPADDGSLIKLSDYRDKLAVVLYFYPKDFTSGCTKQACNFRDNISRIQELNAVVLGVSTDDAETHKRFKEEYSLNYTLLSDTSGEVSSAYSGLRENGLANRVTFIIDVKGIIRKIYRNVDVNVNYIEITDFIKSME